MKILVATTSFPSSVNETLAVNGKFILHECMGFENAGADVTIVTPDIPICPREERFEKNIIVHRFQYFFPRKWQRIKRSDGTTLYDRMDILFWLQFPFFMLFYACAIFKYARNADTIHCNWTLSALAALPARWLLKKPVSVTPRGSDLRLIPKFVNRFIIKNVDLVIDFSGPCFKNMNILSEFPGNYVSLPSIVAPPKADLSDNIKFLKKQGEFVIAVISRFEETKTKITGLPFFELIEAVSILSKKHPIRCIYVGDGTLRPNLEKKVQENGLEDKITFVGFKENVFPYITAADIIIGGVGLNAVSQEAALMGKPILMPALEGWFEGIWFHKENALLFNPGDLNSIIENIEFAINNKDAMKKIAEETLGTADKFIKTIDDGGKIYIEEFIKIIQKRKR